MSKNSSSTAVVICPLRINVLPLNDLQIWLSLLGLHPGQSSGTELLNLYSLSSHHTVPTGSLNYSGIVVIEDCRGLPGSHVLLVFLCYNLKRKYDSNVKVFEQKL